MDSDQNVAALGKQGGASKELCLGEPRKRAYLGGILEVYIVSGFLSYPCRVKVLFADWLQKNI